MGPVSSGPIFFRKVGRKGFAPKIAWHCPEIGEEYKLFRKWRHRGVHRG